MKTLNRPEINDNVKKAVAKVNPANYNNSVVRKSSSIAETPLGIKESRVGIKNKRLRILENLQTPKSLQIF